MRNRPIRYEVKMIDKSASVIKKGQKEDIVNTSCWNCFTVENDNDNETEVPLSKIREDYRKKFRLYSMFASEVSRPKTVPLKQKVKEQYTVSKTIENKLLSESKKGVPPKSPDINTPQHKYSHTESPDSNQEIELPETNQEVEFSKTNQKVETCETNQQEEISETNQEVKIPEHNQKVDISETFQQEVKLSKPVEEVEFLKPSLGNLSSDLNIENLENTKKDHSVIICKGLIETSTPISQKDAKFLACDSPLTIEPQKSKDEDIENIRIGIKNITISEKDDIDAISQDTSSNYLESTCEGSSLRDLNDTGLTKKRNKSHIPIPIKRDFKCTEAEFKSSLPSLNVAQKRHILKSTQSLCEETNEKKIKLKSLRWSTLDLPPKSTGVGDEMYLSDAASPNHATLPRRSNSPLPHERDLLDRDRFSFNKSGLQARSESMASVYSGAGEGTRGNVTVRGEVQISLLYNYRLGALEVGVKRCRELAPVDIKRNRSDPYVKVYLLPDKSKAGKRKTKVKKNTLNPVFEETLSFVQPLASLSARTLWLSVWHADMFGRNDFLGEVTLPLADVVFDDPAPMWYKLHERTEQFDEQQGSRGDLIVALKLDLHEGTRGKGTLHVLVKEAKNLVATKPNGLADVFCKSYLLPERGRLAKQKTAVCRRTLNPKWEHTFTYRGLSLQELSARALELSLWDRDRLASNDFMGAIRLSLGTGTHMGTTVNWMDSVGKEVSLWQMMMQRPNFWVEGSFPLRPHLNN